MTTNKNDFITIVGAKEHNLDNLSIKIPKNKLVVITGLSGSGKSSLAFDTIYAEGRRRYIESLSSYARQFLDLQQKPEVEYIDGLSPSIAIEQKVISYNPRSTVATVTEIYDYMRLLFSRIGQPYSPATGLPIKSQSPSQITDQIKTKLSGKKIMIIAPLVRSKKGEHTAIIQRNIKEGFTKFLVDKYFYNSEEVPSLKPTEKHDISVVIDRIAVQEDVGNRLINSIETALKVGNGIVEILELNEIEKIPSYSKDKLHIFSEKFACPISGFSLPELEPRIFSFNNPYGACLECDGIGITQQVLPELIIKNPELSINEGCLLPLVSNNDLTKSLILPQLQIIKKLAIHHEFSLDELWQDLPKKIHHIILYGNKENALLTKDSSEKLFFEGVIPLINRVAKNKIFANFAAYFQGESTCDHCHGYRLKPEILSVKINSLHIGELCAQTIEKSLEWFSNMKENDKITADMLKISKPIAKEIVNRLGFLQGVGLGYLTLNRSSASLSGGESQRIKLASQIGSGLSGVLYVLDEPSIGLHKSDKDKLISTIIKLKEQGNSIIIVEHDEDTMNAAEHIIDIGPGAGSKGGKIVAQGSLEDIKKSKDSITGMYLNKTLFIEIPKTRRTAKNNHFLEINNVNTNNLKDVSVKFGVGQLTCVTGVSGGGKSSLIILALYNSLLSKLNNRIYSIRNTFEVNGKEFFSDIIKIDQSPIGRTPRSNPATYTGTFTYIRDCFTSLIESKARGYRSGRFSFNVKGGRCEPCQGEGHVRIEMYLLPDMYIKCSECHGRRYNPETLEIKYKGKSISDILEMTIEESVVFFEHLPAVHDKLKIMLEVGLGYIKLGQPATTLSGGEAQRIKLAKELAKKSNGKTLYILDEPTTGLHTHDIKHLLKVLHKLVDQGNTMIIIEHNMDVLKTADHIIEIGPCGGEKGGYVVSSGSPEETMKSGKSIISQDMGQAIKAIN